LFSIEEWYSRTTAIVFAGLAFAPLSAWLYLISAVFCFTNFWSFKLMVVKAYKRERVVGNHLMGLALKFLMVALLAHFVIGSLVLSSTSLTWRTSSIQGEIKA